jgi:hypothetical protein
MTPPTSGFDSAGMPRHCYAWAFPPDEPSSPAAPASRENGDRLFEKVYHTIREMLSEKIIFLFGVAAELKETRPFI